MAGPKGKAPCGLSINVHLQPGLDLDFQTNPAHLSQTIANATSL